MPASAYLKQELKKKDRERKRQAGRTEETAESAGKDREVRQPAGNEGSTAEAAPALTRGSAVSNESSAAELGGMIPAAEGEHLRGIYGGNNGAFGAYTHDDSENAESSVVRETLDKADYTVTAGGDRAKFTPSHYAAWLKIWGDPRDAVRYYTRYLELSDRKKAGEISREEERELGELSRLEQSALEFGDARHYMQEKNAFTQQDVDYAFSQNPHRKDGSKTSQFGTAHQAAGVWQAFFLDGVFGGMKEKYLSEEGRGGIPEEAVRALKDGADPDTLGGMKQWLDEYLSGCVRDRRRGMSMILRSILRSDPKHTRYTMMDHLEDVLKRVYFKKEFMVTNTDARMLAADRYLGQALALLMRDPGSRFTQMIRVLIERILAEQV